ncbi:nudC domain-containing protein 1 [Trichonephila clavipes]|nr:nudC domain-containing protein 1 [Trichonephila clavipes]
MAIMDLKVNRDMLDIKFEGYKLSLDPIPVLKQPVVDGVRCCELSSEDYSYLHTRMALLHNYLFQDPWSQNSVFYINERLRVMWTSLGEEQQSVIRFLAAEGEKPASIHRQMVTVYEEKCVSDKSVRKWSARFRSGHESVGDDQSSGQASTVITSDLIDNMDDLVRSDRCVTLRMLMLKVDVSYESVDNCTGCDFGRCMPLGSEAAHRPTKGTVYGTSTVTSVSVSGRPRFHQADRHR